MRALSILLLVAVFVRHGSSYWIADISGFTPAAVSYMLGGLEEVALAFTIAVMLFAYRESLWRNLGLGACAIAALEGSQMAGCRLLIADIHAVPPRTTLCEHLTGLPVGPIMLTLYLLIVCYALGSAFDKG